MVIAHKEWSLAERRLFLWFFQKEEFSTNPVPRPLPLPREEWGMPNAMSIHFHYLSLSLLLSLKRSVPILEEWQLASRVWSWWEGLVLGCRPNPQVYFSIGFTGNRLIFQSLSKSSVYLLICMELGLGKWYYIWSLLKPQSIPWYVLVILNSLHTLS